METRIAKGWTPLVLALVTIAGACLVRPPSADGQRFLTDDPVWTDPDNVSIPEPSSSAISKGYDFLENTFGKPGGAPGPARNVNTLGEVPDSSWFTNRIGRRPMTIEEIVRGPNTGDGPDTSSNWTITSLKTDGITPGFQIRDSRGEVYVIKLDPMVAPQITTSAEVISTKFFHAFGYNVPENYLALLDPSRLAIGPDARFTDPNGVRRLLSEADLQAVLEEVPRRSDGTIQVMASRFVRGKPLGPFKFYGTRSDDPNDIFSHEDRRELRGLRVFAAWLNHNDSDAANTLDTYVTEGNQSYIKHYLIDFGTTLGSGAFEPKVRRAGNEYYLEWTPILKSVISLGFRDRPWRTWPYPDFPSIGRFESKHFRPELWRPDYPNPAFRRMQLEDSFWATRIVAGFSDDMVRAIVSTGQLIDPEAEAYLVETLIERRDEILRHYLSLLNPLDEFRVDPGRGSLTFQNLGMKHGIGTARSYRYRWFRFDSDSGATEPLTEPRRAADTEIPLPTENAGFLMVRIETVSDDKPDWNRQVDVFIRNGARREVVGIDRR